MGGLRRLQIEAEAFDDRVGEQLFTHLADLLFSDGTLGLIDLEFEVFACADTVDSIETKSPQSAAYRDALWVIDSWFECDSYFGDVHGQVFTFSR